MHVNKILNKLGFMVQQGILPKLFVIHENTFLNIQNCIAIQL